MVTPIDAWPTRKHRGSPGYSGRHYASLAGAQEDPLRVAERLLSSWEAEQIRDAANVKAEREGYGASVAWMTDELIRSRKECWDRLCCSFQLVINTLERQYRIEQRPGLKTLIAAAKREARKHGGSNG